MYSLGGDQLLQITFHTRLYNILLPSKTSSPPTIYLWLVLVPVPRHDNCILIQAVLKTELLPCLLQGWHGPRVTLSLDLSHKLPVNAVLVSN